MPLHLETPWDSSWANSIDFYPGTSFTYLVPMAAHTSLSLYSNMLGFVTMQKTEQQILSSGLQDMQALPLNRLFASHACLPSNESSLECQLDSHVEKLDNMYVDSMSAWTEQTPIAEYVYPNDDYATTVSTNYCCEVALSVCLCFWRVSYLPPFYKNSLSLAGVISGISRWGNTRIFSSTGGGFGSHVPSGLAIRKLQQGQCFCAGSRWVAVGALPTPDKPRVVLRQR